MNDDPCKEVRERFYDAESDLIMIKKRKPRMQLGETEISKTENNINIQNPDFDDEGWKKDVEIAQQQKDKALKEYDECEEKHGN